MSATSSGSLPAPPVHKRRPRAPVEVPPPLLLRRRPPLEGGRGA
eukprot:CAMPEP_0206250782 /NCGR_PEP_ID=MMETSP0047_2-20121206/21664_1 /ASSEMBLY_ACC=CAM_ASM_000192 /TAXON_ID=195065 /ORGANISM="Chroomonas mesostigmatica_cf, Strain CCMP1168" /LENGTH=43 /DNA_ID= /DNA_START= /DNA_END= /DNA_ORIENTATION=